MVSQPSLYDTQGRRKYLNHQEREAFRLAAEKAPRRVRTFCHTLLYTGCRISEALMLTAESIDFQSGVIVFESLKKRKRGIYRAVPAPPRHLDALNLVHGIDDLKPTQKNERLWAWARSTASLKVAQVMDKAGLQGIHATPKGLRHGFGVACIERQIPLNLVQRWLGHAALSTTAIYVDAVGEEERNLASRLWD